MASSPPLGRTSNGFGDEAAPTPIVVSAGLFEAPGEHQAQSNN
jgi:hypothetical protein